MHESIGRWIDGWTDINDTMNESIHEWIDQWMHHLMNARTAVNVVADCTPLHLGGLDGSHESITDTCIEFGIYTYNKHKKRVLLVIPASLVSARFGPGALGLARPWNQQFTTRRLQLDGLLPCWSQGTNSIVARQPLQLIWCRKRLAKMIDDIFGCNDFQFNSFVPSAVFE